MSTPDTRIPGLCQGGDTMFSYDTIKNKPRLLRAMTGLDRSEFEELLKPFHAAWDAYVNETWSANPNRQRQPGGGRHPVLRTPADKLLFIVYYLKTYPLHEVLAFEFGMTQGQACTWIYLLSEVLKRAVASMGQVPERHSAALAATLAESGETTFGIDGTERKIQRPKDDERQRQHYSGKKKSHTVKNNVVVTLGSRVVKYLSGTYEGKKHDKKICDDEQPTFPEGSTLYKDTGFQGYEPAGVRTYQPKKKPRGQELSAAEKQHSTLISKVRIIVEHVISGIKRCRIVKDIFRNLKDGFNDVVMELACALHNFRTTCRSRAQSAVPYSQ